MSKFILKCVKNTHPDIELPNLVPVAIGRSPLTQITNKRLSKKHCKFVANIPKKQVHFTVIGHNNARLNGVKVIAKNESVLLKSGDKIELLEGLYEHELMMFESEPEIRESNRIQW